MQERLMQHVSMHERVYMMVTHDWRYSHYNQITKFYSRETQLTKLDKLGLKLTMTAKQSLFHVITAW